MATLAENAAAVKAAQVAIDAAIVAKGGTTDGGLTNAAAAIAALPSGGDYEPIEDALAVMTGEPQEGKGADELAEGITQITRKGNRRATESQSGETQPSELAPFDPVAGAQGTSWKIRITHHEVDYAIRYWQRIAGHNDVTVDWGDGNVEVVSRNLDVSTSLYHSYDSNGEYVVRVSDDVANLGVTFGSTESDASWQYDLRHRYSREAVVEVLQYGNSITQLDGATHTHCGCFTSCVNLVSASAFPPLVTILQAVYSACVNLRSVPRIDCPFCTNMRSAFEGCSGLTGTPDLSALAACTNMQSAFSGCSGLTGTPDLSALAACTNMQSAFEGCSGLTGTPDLSALAACTNMQSAFFGCSGLTGTPDLSALAACTSMQSAFYGCSGLTGTPDLSALAACTSMQSAFEGCSGLTGTPDLSALAACTNMQSAFRGCSGLTGTPDLSALAACTSMLYAFEGCSGLTGTPDLSALAACTSMQSAFEGCSGLTGTPDLSALAACTSMYAAFSGCSGLTGTPDLSALAACTSMQYAFYGCSNIEGYTGLESMVVCTNMQQTFYNCGKLKTKIGAWPQAVNNTNQCFYGCCSIEGVEDGLTDADIMPPRISNSTNCVNMTNDAVRARFLTTYGGTRSV